jgi:hypothetical protein
LNPRDIPGQVVFSSGQSDPGPIALACANCGEPATGRGTLDSEPFARDVPLCAECAHDAAHPGNAHPDEWEQAPCHVAPALLAEIARDQGAASAALGKPRQSEMFAQGEETAARR